MNGEIRTMLEGRINRRTFLRGSTLFAAAALGSAALPRLASAQDPQDKKDGPDREQQEKKDDKKDGGQEKDPFKETKIDQNGREYRTCPVCGFNMYRQDRTWTCENCGYSYTE